ncbi:MAG: response regulator transcription factor [Rhodanobacter sp.]|jgi:DNA-binding NarL/FixJ family response regulator|nr:response regulator transcription factor [Rhodanobacter sp.]
MDERVTVLLVDDHAVVREGYRRLLERDPRIVVCAEAADSDQAYRDFGLLHPVVAVVDIALPRSSGIELTRRLLARDAAAKILIFSMHDEGIFVRKAFEAGAIGYITKASAPEVLVEAVYAVAQGRRYLSRDVARILAKEAPAGEVEAVHALSPREFEIFTLLAQGHSAAAIGERLCISAKTVANLQSVIRQKLGATNSAQLAQIAARCGIGVLGVKERPLIPSPSRPP